MRDDDWAELISRLELEVLQRTSVPPTRERVNNPWAEMRVRLHNVARALVPPADAEDVVQTVLLHLQIPETFRRLKASRSPRGYAAVMVRNAIVDLARRRSRSLREEHKWAEVGIVEPDEELYALRRSATVAEMLEELAESERELLRLRFWEGVSMAEIARRLDLPYSTVAVRMFRLLRRLRERLEPTVPPSDE